MKYFAPTRLSDNIHKTPEGFLLCVGVSIGHCNPMVYGAEETPLTPGADGKVEITRDPEDLFSAKTMASFEGKALTIRHPEEFVNPENWSDLAKGHIQNVRRGTGDQKDDLVCDILVTDKMAIDMIWDLGIREVSCGYEAEYIQLEDGKGRQTDIIGNHLALVDEGRAGPEYAITDHKMNGKGKLAMKKKFGEKLKELFAKTADEATKILDAEEEPKEKAKDAEAKGYDELVQMVKDLGEMVKGMKSGKDEDPKADKPAKDEEVEVESEDEDKEEKAKDADGDIEARLKALEMAVEKIMQAETAESEAMEDEDMKESEDDDAEEETVMTGDSVNDTAVRAEILAPGIKITKDVCVKALRQAYGTKDGKRCIDQLTGGKPKFDAQTAPALFVAASEMLKASRSSQLAATKRTTDFQSSLETEGVMTAERMNAINAERYKQV